MTPFSAPQHAFAPLRGFHSRPIPAVRLCALRSPFGHWQRLAFAPLVELPYPPSCLPSLGAALLSALFAAYHRCGTMKALTPAPLTHSAGLPAYLATPSCRSVSNHVGCLDIASPTTPACPAFFGLALESQARRSFPPNRVRSPTDRQFASRCSPPRLAATQLRSATEL